MNNGLDIPNNLNPEWSLKSDWSSRVLYLVDGKIVGEKEMGSFDVGEKELRDRERTLNNWLMEQGW